MATSVNSRGCAATYAAFALAIAAARSAKRPGSIRLGNPATAKLGSPPAAASGSGRMAPRATTNSVAASAAGNAGDRRAIDAGVAGQGPLGVRWAPGSVRKR